jgi:hypothetical protein
MKLSNISISVLNCRYVEELVRLPGCFLCYTPSPEAGPVVKTPAISNGFVTFGSFNNLAKVKILKNTGLVEFGFWFVIDFILFCRSELEYSVFGQKYFVPCQPRD